jgi:hypothetical protein
VLWLAFAHPVAALVAVALLVGLSAWLIPKLWRFVRGLLRKAAGAGPAAKGGADV